MHHTVLLFLACKVTSVVQVSYLKALGAGVIHRHGDGYVMLGPGASAVTRDRASAWPGIPKLTALCSRPYAGKQQPHKKGSWS